MFVFWELVGLSSYLLIGFWFQRPAAADAAKKAFLTNRLGDFGFLTGIILTWAVAGTLNFDELKGQLLRNPELFDTTATLAGLLIFCGAVGKSAQFPLHVWLPDAMEGPTPVSALIHAATMVAAGVYMLCRVFFLFTGPSLHVISWIGGITALLAALIAVQQDDIKRILAYSTLSQLGYMVMAVGFNEPAAAMFHLTTHAFFKALLFLAAGAVIHAMSHEQNIWQMGGLRKKIPLTYRTFMAGTLALCGVWPLSGFYSKDAILAAAWQHSPTLFAVGVLAAFLTSFYMFRLVIVVFFGKLEPELHEHPPKSRQIAYPLVILAVLSVIGGFLGIRQFIAPQLSPNAAEIPFFAPWNRSPPRPWRRPWDWPPSPRPGSGVCLLCRRGLRPRCPDYCLASVKSSATNFTLTNFTRRWLIFSTTLRPGPPTCAIWASSFWFAWPKAQWIGPDGFCAWPKPATCKLTPCSWPPAPRWRFI